jgi:PIN domain nuclease of toxin-antitoxin system
LDVHSPESTVILLDTNALIWLLAGHKRARRLPQRSRLYASPVSLLELRFLDEVGRIRLKSTIESVEDDGRFAVDDPSSTTLFKAAADLPWTRDPFDRLIVGHARMRGWRLATSDSALLEHLPAAALVEL